MALKVDEEGYLVGEDGERLLIDGEPQKVEGVVAQDKFDKTLGERLAKEREKLNNRIKALEEIANKTPGIEEELKNAKAEKADLEQRLTTAEKEAQDKVSSQLSKLTKERDELKSGLENEQRARVIDQVSVAILGHAKDRFINPERDLVPVLLGAHKREPKKGEDGKTVDGQFVDVFKMRRKDGDKTVEEFVPLDKAVEIFATDEANAHYVKPSGRGGSGGGTYGGGGQDAKNGFQYATMK